MSSQTLRARCLVALVLGPLASLLVLVARLVFKPAAVHAPESAAADVAPIEANDDQRELIAA